VSAAREGRCDSHHDHRMASIAVRAPLLVRQPGQRMIPARARQRIRARDRTSKKAVS
jgi:hypothetical protein